MITDSDRYAWFLSHAGLVQEKAKLWNPVKHKPLLKYLHNYITQEVEKENKIFLETQRRILDE